MTDILVQTQEKAIGRPLVKADVSVLVSCFTGIDSFQAIDTAGLLYVAASDLQTAPPIEEILPDLEEEGIIGQSARQPLEVTSRRLIVSRRGAFCRLIVEVGDIPTQEYEDGGLMQGERRAIASQLAPGQAPGKRLNLASIVHPISLGTASTDQIAEVKDMATQASMVLSKRLRLGGIGPISSPLNS